MSKFFAVIVICGNRISDIEERVGFAVRAMSEREARDAAEGEVTRYLSHLRVLRSESVEHDSECAAERAARPHKRGGVMFELFV